MPRRQGRGADQHWDWREAHLTCLRLAQRYAAGPDAEDIAQEAVTRAWRFRATLRRADRRDQWLATIVRNEAARMRARPWPEPVADADLTEGVEDERIAAIATRAGLEEAISGLAVEERTLLVLRYGCDLTQPTIARMLGVPEGTVKARLHRTRAKLQLELGEV